MAVGFFDVRNITIRKKKVPLPFMNSFSAYGLCCQGRTDQSAAKKLHMHSTKSKECGATFLWSSSKNLLARVVHKASLSWREASDGAEIGVDVPSRAEARQRCPYVDLLLLMLRRQWCKVFVERQSNYRCL